MILSNVELQWVKLDPSSPDMGFSGDKPQWNVVMVTRSEKQADEWRSLGLNPRENDGEFKITVRKDAVKRDGNPNKPVPVVGPDLMPIEDVTSIGNGTTANVKLRTFDYDYRGKKGVGVRLDAIQIIKLKEYAGGAGAGSLGFTALEVPEDDSSDDDLYD